MNVKMFVTFFIVQAMYFVLGLAGGVKWGTFDAGALCLLSQLSGVLGCIIQSLGKGKVN